MTLEIITPEKTLFSSENAKSVICPGIDGEFQILDNHASIASALKKGRVVVIKHDDSKEEFEIKSGVVECSSSIVNVLVEE